MVIIFLVYAFTAFTYGKNREITFWKIRFKKVSQLLPCTTRLTGLSREHVTQRLLHKRWRYMIIGSLSNDDGDGNENGKKAIGFTLAKKQLCTCITLFCTFLCRDFTLCGRREHKTTTLFFFFWSLIQSFRVQLQKKSPTFDELIEMEYTRLSLKPREHFLTEVFVAVAVVIT